MPTAGGWNRRPEPPRREAEQRVLEAARQWRINHVCCPKDCPDLIDAQRRLGDALDALDGLSVEKAPPAQEQP